jgi:hypothetical protein
VARNLVLLLRTSILLLLLAAFPCVPAAQTGVTDADRAVPLIRVLLEKPDDSRRLKELGLDIIAMRPDEWADVLGWPGAERDLNGAGLSHRVVESDFGRALAVRNGVALPPRRDRLTPLSVPPPGMGSMGGYYTLAEVNALLDSLAASDAQGIVSAVDSIGASRQGRPIRAIRIASEASPDHSRPRVLYTSLTHAREPGGMQSLFAFIDRLIDGYGTDPNLTYLVDHREMWFIPVINPDGYVRNEQTWFGTGSFGMWRKNLRDNDGNGTINSSDGVDLNRNFGYQWGFDNIGSSPTPGSQTYRGPSAFSEPETQALRDFSVAHQFSTADNYHTFGEMCLYPWNYNGQDTPDSDFLIRLAEEMMTNAHYAYGTAPDILYGVNGDANDWMYGEQSTKPKTLAMTTEIGDETDYFYPPPSRIVPLAELQIRPNIVLAYAAGIHVRAEGAEILSGDGFLHPGLSAPVSVTLRNQGLLATDGGVTVTASTAAPGITVTDPASTFPPLPPGTTAPPSGNDFIEISASPSVPAGTVVDLVLTINDQGDYALRDTVTVTVGEPVVVLSDDASQGLARWTAAGGWGIQVVSGDSLFSDSPAGFYTAGTNRTLTLAAPLDLSGGLAAFLTFRQTWDIERGYDCGRVEVSTNGGSSWTALGGRMTRPGHGNTGAYSGGVQGPGEPCYDATQRIEETEIIDLTPWVGLTDVRLRFRLSSDGGLQRNGWYVDDIEVRVYPEDVSAAPDPVAVSPVTTLSPASPNPFQGGTRLSASFDRPAVFHAAVYTVAGRLVRVLASGIAGAGDRDLYWDGTAAHGRPAPAGLYYIRVQGDGWHLTRAVTRVR